MSQALRLQDRLNLLPGIQHVALDDCGEAIQVTYAVPANQAIIERTVQDCGLFTTPEAMVHEYQAWQTFLANDELNDA